MAEVTHVDRESLPVERNPRKLTILEFRRLLGLPESTELPGLLELPDNFFLPKSYLGNLEEAVYQSQVSNREFSQRIDWMGKVEVQKLLKGGESSAKAGFNRRGNGLVYYHTHLGGLGFSEVDVAFMLVRQKGLIEGAARLFGGLEFGIDILLATRDSDRLGGNLIQAFKNKLIIERDLKRNDFAFLDDDMQAEILGSYGLGYYRALGENRGGWQLISTKILFKDGGLKFARITAKNE